VTDGAAELTGDSDRSFLIAPHGHVAFAGHDWGRWALEEPPADRVGIVRIEDRARIRGVAATRETKALANRLPGNFSARIQNAREAVLTRWIRRQSHTRCRSCPHSPLRPPVAESRRGSRDRRERLFDGLLPCIDEESAELSVM
jgi:hypothetical protein